MLATRDADALDRITSTIICSAIDIHQEFGPGLFESTYLACLTHDLRSSGLHIEAQKAIPLLYRGVRLDCAYRVDLIVECAVIVEVKAIEAVSPIHSRQLYTYLRFADCAVGLLLNFGAATLKEGIKRVVNGFPDGDRRHRERQPESRSRERLMPAAHSDGRPDDRS